MLDKVSFSPGMVLPSWVELEKALAGPAGLDGSASTLVLCCGDALSSLTLAAGVGFLSGGRWGGSSGSRVPQELLSAGLAGTSRRIGVFLFHPP